MRRFIRQWIRYCVLGSIVLVLFAAPTAVASAQDINNQTVADAVEDELLFDKAVPSLQIDVSVNEGVVMLSGKVGNLLAKVRATRLAETVKGVRSIINKVEVVPTQDRSDSALKRDIDAELFSDPATDSYEVTVSVQDGTATLTGSVDSWTEKELAGKVAMGVTGVREIKNEISVDYNTDRGDAEIKPEIQKALRWDALIDHALVDVQVNNGNVSLKGTVGSAAEKRRVRYNSWVAGVQSVDVSGLQVEAWARNEDLRKDKYTAKSADEIRSALKDGLLYDPRVLSFNVTADIAGSTVTLRGVVDNLKAKRAAAQVARNTVGVTYVTNRLKVRPEETRTALEIENDFRDSLLRDPYVDRYEIAVDVTDGIVTLKGTVDTYMEKWTADDNAARTNGVIAVKNKLHVDTPDALAYDPYVFDDYVYLYDWYDYEPEYTFETDMEILGEIQDELFWSPFIDSDDVTVVVDDGEATLAGTVDSWSEFHAATENAYEGGAVWVDNDLIVE